MYTVLVIDDSRDALESLSMLLEDAGYEVVCCAEPDRALQLCHEVHFDVILCDVYMQGGAHVGSSLAGINVMWRLSEQFPSLPLIAMSGFLEEEQLQRIKKSNVAAVLSKPFGRKELLQAMSTALERGSPVPRE